MSVDFSKCELLNYEKLNRIADEKSTDYLQATPFPHIVIDDFLSAELVSALAKKFPLAQRKEGQGEHSASMDDGTPAQHNKVWQSQQSGLDLSLRRLCWELNSGTFLTLLEKLSGIHGLLPDPHLKGGGAHQILPGGFLKIHADFNKHPETLLDRRINLLIYFNDNWKDSYGGHLELWPENMTACAQKILPIAGRCVIFSTSQTSYHGHPIPMSCPPDRTRKSLALYYYSVGGPGEERQKPMGTVWQTPGK
jgi:Rps23 Pro-64 3,4-dihydroxylase Tpa1-like proline 4-hydroxylase